MVLLFFTVFFYYRAANFLLPFFPLLHYLYICLRVWLGIDNCKQRLLVVMSAAVLFSYLMEQNVACWAVLSSWSKFAFWEKGARSTHWFSKFAAISIRGFFKNHETPLSFLPLSVHGWVDWLLEKKSEHFHGLSFDFFFQHRSVVKRTHFRVWNVLIHHFFFPGLFELEFQVINKFSAMLD